MKTTIKHNTYQNLLLIGLMLSGAIKPLLAYYDFPFDVTLIFLLAIAIDILFCLLTRRKRVLTKNQLCYVLLVLSFYTFAGLSLFYSVSESYGYKKLFFMLIPILGFLYPIFIKQIRLGLLYKAIIYIIIPVSIWFILFRFLWSANISPLNFIINKSKFAEFRKEYLQLGYLLGVFILLAVKYARNAFNTIAVSVVLMLGLGSRGALIFTFFCLIIFYYRNLFNSIIHFRLKKQTLNKIALYTAPLIVVFAIFYSKVLTFISNGLARFSSLTDFSSDSSSLTRIDQLSVALEEGLTLRGMTIGHGLGSWGFLYTGADVKLHPHNILVETWIELGFFAALFLAFFFFAPFFLKRITLIKSLALFAILNALKSSSFAYDRSLFIIFGILIFIETVIENKVNVSYTEYDK